MGSFEDKSFNTASSIDSTSFSMDKMLDAVRLLKDLKEKYPQNDKIDIFLITYNNNLFAPETILKSEYENKIYVIMNVFNFKKLIDEVEKYSSFDVLHQGWHHLSGIPVWYDDELIKKILNYHIDKMIEKYREELEKESYSFPYYSYFWNPKSGIS